MATKITSFDRTNATALMNAIKAACAQVEADFGVKIQCAGGTMDGATLKAKFACTVSDTAAKEADERRKFGQAAFLFGLKAEDYGREFTWAGRTMRLVGIEHRRTRFPLLCREVLTGKEKLLPREAVARMAAAA
jgi:hypothetical protein